MRKLKVSLDEIAFIMESQDDGVNLTVFDAQTGEVIAISDEVMTAIEEGGEKALEDLPDWQKDQIDDAKNIISDKAGRYVEIPRKPSYEGYHLMVEFAETAKDNELREKLAMALDGKGAFKRFKNVLMDYPDEENKWFAFKDKRLKEEIIEWLNSLGINPE